MVAATGCVSVMIGRGALGSPWIFDEAFDALSPEDQRAYKARIIARHCELIRTHYREKYALIQMKKHLAWYTEGLGHAAERVLGAGPMLHDKDADPVGRGDPADRVRHVQAGALLPDDDRADVGLRGRFDDGVDRISDEELDSFALQDLCDGSSRLHVGSPCSKFSQSLLQSDLRTVQPT